jgi:hypothetical protein
MSVKHLHMALGYEAYCCGNILSNEQCVVLQNSLLILQNGSHSEHIFIYAGTNSRPR